MVSLLQVNIWSLDVIVQGAKYCLLFLSSASISIREWNFVITVEFKL